MSSHVHVALLKVCGKVKGRDISALREGRSKTDCSIEFLQLLRLHRLSAATTRRTVRRNVSDRLRSMISIYVQFEKNRIYNYADLTILKILLNPQMLYIVCLKAL